MDRYISFEMGEFYHVYNRGVNKQNIFFEERDKVHFQRLLYTRNGTKRIDSALTLNRSLSSIDRGSTIVDIIAYALMPNHFHLLLCENQEGGISQFMRKLGTAMAMYINTKYERSGPLMCRPFRSKHVDGDEYLRWVLSYIHSNPLELIYPHWKENGVENQKKALQFLATYPYSSYVDYAKEGRDESKIISKDALPIKSVEIGVDLLKILAEDNKKQF